MRKPSSLNSGAFRFALLISSVFALGSIFLLAIVEHSIRTYASEATAVGLRSETSVLTEDSPEGGDSELIDTIRHRQRSAYEQPFHYLLTNAEGRRLAGDLPAKAAKIGWSEVTFVDDRPPSGEQGDQETLRSLGTRLADGSLLVVATDTFDVQTLRRRLAAFTIGSSIALTLFALVGGYSIGLVFLRRLDRVNGAVARIMAGNLSDRLPPIGMGPEFDHLSRNLNTMLDRIAMLVDGLRQVSTDIAHDLRTPLTRLQQRLEQMRGAGSLETYEAGIDAALSQVDEIHAIFRALLRIGLIEGGSGRSRLQAVDLSALLDLVTDAFRPVAEDRRRMLRVEIARDLAVFGDRELLAQMFTNLIENALAHTPDGSSIVVGLRPDGDQAIASVADDGPGVPASERVKVLRRFYRLDSSRHTPGSGLGLSLVAAVAGLHRADLTLADNGPGLLVSVAFELHRPGPPGSPTQHPSTS